MKKRKGVAPVKQVVIATGIHKRPEHIFIQINTQKQFIKVFPIPYIYVANQKKQNEIISALRKGSS